MKVRQEARDTGGSASPLRIHLLWLTLACSIPIVLAACVLGYFFVANEYQRSQSTVDERLRLMKNALEARVGNIIEDLQILASAPSLQDDNLASFHEYATRASNVFGGNGIVLVKRDGQQVMATRQPWSAALPKRTQLDAQNRVFATGRPQVSDLVKAAADGRPIVSVEVPVLTGSEVKYVLATALSPDYLSNVLREHVPEGWIGSIVDRNGILVARSSDAAGAEDLIGRPTIPEVRRHIGEPWVRSIKTISRIGVPMYSSLMRSEQLGLSVNLAMTRETLDGPVWRAATFLGGLALLAILLSVAGARLMSRRLVGALSALEGHVLALRGGSEPPTVDTKVSEVAHMQTVLHDVGADISNAHAAIERERSLLKATVQSMPVGVLLVDRTGRPILVNDMLLRLWGQSHIDRLEDLKGIRRFRLDGTAYPLTEWPSMRALAGEELVGEEVLQSGTEGSLQRLVINSAPIKDGAGTIIAAVVACYDVTELRAALHQQQVLVDEINHRVKNTLATVQSIARLTRGSSTTVDGYAKAFEERILALSRAYNLLTENKWEGTDLSILVKDIVSPYGHGSVQMSGPKISLSASHSLAMAAALHELSTNASKYGALSVASGCVDVTWARVGDFLRLAWRERNGPPVAPPTRQGFGTKMIEQNLARDTGWRVKLNYDSSGFECLIELPLSGSQKSLSDSSDVDASPANESNLEIAAAHLPPLGAASL